MSEDEVRKIILVLKSRSLSPREVQLKRILVKDTNMARINDALDDHPDLRSIAYDLLQVNV